MSLHWRKGRILVIVIRGPKRLTCLVQEADGLHQVTLGKAEERFMHPLMHNGEAYPLPKASRHFGRLAGKSGTNQSARDLLARWRGENL